MAINFVSGGQKTKFASNLKGAERSYIAVQFNGYTLLFQVVKRQQNLPVILKVQREATSQSNPMAIHFCFKWSKDKICQ